MLDYEQRMLHTIDALSYSYLFQFVARVEDDWRQQEVEEERMLERLLE
jgi:hypothetical protein